MRASKPFELRRVDNLPAYALATVRDLTASLRGRGVDVIDLGFGNPDLSSPLVAVTRLQEAASGGQNHRYSSSRGIPDLRAACSALYERTFGVELDADSEIVATMGAKEGFVHLMWALLEPGDVAVVPSPSYPIHIQGPLLAGGEVVPMPMTLDGDLFASFDRAWSRSERTPRVIVLSFPHNPTTAVADVAFMEHVIRVARKHNALVVHDFAYADLAFDGYRPPSILEVPGARDVAVELYTLSKSFSMAGWRVGFLVGNAQVVDGLARLKSWLDYGAFQPIQIAAAAALDDASETPGQVREVYQARRDALCEGLARIGWDVQPPRATMFLWARIPDRFSQLSSAEFSALLAREAHVAVSPGAGFGPGGEGFVRFVSRGAEKCTTIGRRKVHHPPAPRMSAPLRRSRGATEPERRVRRRGRVRAGGSSCL